MRMAVTGGTGYLGGRLIQRLRQEEGELVALARDPGKVPESWGDRIQVVQGDVTQKESLGQAFQGVDVLFHVAAHVRRWDPDPSNFFKVNVAGLRNVLEVAQAQKIPKIIYTSSFIALGPSGSMPLTEEEGLLDREYRNEYEETKALGLKLAREFVAKGSPIITVIPGIIFGPGAMTQGNLMAGLLMRSLLPIIGPGDLPWCYSWVEDVVEGHILAWKKGQTPDEYLLGGENKTMVEFLEELAAIKGKKPLSLKFPYAVAKAIAHLQMLKTKIRGDRKSVV